MFFLSPCPTLHTVLLRYCATDAAFHSWCASGAQRRVMCSIFITVIWRLLQIKTSMANSYQKPTFFQSCTLSKLFYKDSSSRLHAHTKIGSLFAKQVCVIGTVNRDHMSQNGNDYICILLFFPETQDSLHQPSEVG